MKRIMIQRRTRVETTAKRRERVVLGITVAAIASLSVACGRPDPGQALVADVCAAVEGGRTSEETYENALPQVYEAFERAAELGMNEESFGRALERRCGQALRETSEGARAYEEAREAEHKALLDRLNIVVQTCTDERASGTITNTADQPLPAVAVTIHLYTPRGLQLTSSHVSVGDLAPGQTRDWVAPRAPETLPEELPYHVARCDPLAGGGY